MSTSDLYSNSLVIIETDGPPVVDSKPLGDRMNRLWDVQFYRCIPCEAHELNLEPYSVNFLSQQEIDQRQTETRRNRPVTSDMQCLVITVNRNHSFYLGALIDRKNCWRRSCMVVRFPLRILCTNKCSTRMCFTQTVSLDKIITDLNPSFQI